VGEGGNQKVIMRAQLKRSLLQNAGEIDLLTIIIIAASTAILIYAIDFLVKRFKKKA
jgi:hypothetical protein